MRELVRLRVAFSGAESNSVICMQKGQLIRSAVLTAGNFIMIDGYQLRIAEVWYIDKYDIVDVVCLANTSRPLADIRSDLLLLGWTDDAHLLDRMKQFVSQLQELFKKLESYLQSINDDGEEWKRGKPNDEP